MSGFLSPWWGSSRSLPRELWAGSLAADLQPHILELRREPYFDIDKNSSKTKQICTQHAAFLLLSGALLIEISAHLIEHILRRSGLKTGNCRVKHSNFQEPWSHSIK